MAPSQVLRISGIKLENANGVKCLELTVGGQQRKVFQESGHNTVIRANFNPALECISQDPISVLIKYRASFSEALLQKVIEIPINPLDVLSQTSNDNKFRYQLSSKPGFVLEIAAQNVSAVCIVLVKPTRTNVLPTGYRGSCEGFQTT